MFKRSENKKTRKTISPGRARTPLTSYYRGQRPPADSSPFVRRQPKLRLRRYAFGAIDIILIIILISGLIYSLIITPDPVIKANDLTFHSLSDYKSAAAAQLGHINNRNKITFDEAGLSAALKKQFPEINSVQIELPLFSEQPVIFLSTNQPTFFLDSQGTRYVVDSFGRAVAKSANLPAVKNLPIINDASGFTISTGRQVLSSSGVTFINTLIGECRHAGIQISALTLPAVPQELDLKAKNQGYFVKFFLGGDALTQAGQYFATRHHFNESGHQPAQYLDVRVPGKVFYK